MQNIAAQQGHRDTCFALTTWYLIGSPGVLPQSDTKAYLWAKKAAEAGLARLCMPSDTPMKSELACR